MAPRVSLIKGRGKPLAVFSAGLLFSRPLRRVIRAAGYSIFSGWIRVADRQVGVWGRIPMSLSVMSRWPSERIVTFEDTFLRSVLSGLKEPPIGLNIDELGVHFDARKTSRLEEILQFAELTDSKLLERAANGRAFLRHYGLSKYNPVPRGHGEIPTSGYVLVVDQLAGDASIRDGMAGAETFARMLAAAKAENPDKRIIIRTHPAAKKAGKTGHFDVEDADEKTTVCAEALNPWDLLEGAAQVYCVTSQMGFDAILAGHRPEVFGIPFYAGWGLSNDRQIAPRRTRTLSVEQLFAGAMLIYPFWYNHARRTACDFEEAAQQLLAQARHHWDGLRATHAVGMRLWKRQQVAKFLSGGSRNVVFHSSDRAALQAAQKDDGQIVVWASRESATLEAKARAAKVPLLRMEDGFLRSAGLGAELTPAVSLVLDNRGIYYDPGTPSQLEELISNSVDLPDFAITRAMTLRKNLRVTGVSKYNLKGGTPELPQGVHKILVVGQVEDDASISLGADAICTNLELLEVARAKKPDAFIVYKPHPDVVAGLRKGLIPDVDLNHLCDLVVGKSDPTGLIEICDEIWTMTSLMGFEALLRDKPVVCLGTPFYAGWGLTRDIGKVCVRRNRKVSLDQLVHAALLDYPRYRDPVSGMPCTAELIVERLASGASPKPPVLKVLAKLQGLMASRASIWR